MTLKISQRKSDVITEIFISRGVAIGDLSKVVSARRSELYTWFQGNGGGTAGGEKVQKIINGASVLVDYNPTLRGNLPPGANEFNKALAVYRK